MLWISKAYLESIQKSKMLKNVQSLTIFVKSSISDAWPILIAPLDLTENLENEKNFSDFPLIFLKTEKSKQP